MGMLQRVKDLIADHPQSTADPDRNPTSGVESPVSKSGHDPHQSDPSNWIKAGMGGERRGEDAPDHVGNIRAGSLTSPDVAPAVADPRVMEAGSHTRR